MSVVDPDSDDDDGNGSVVIGLMQKNRRKMRKEGKNEMTIGYAVYEVGCCEFIFIICALTLLVERRNGDDVACF